MRILIYGSTHLTQLCCEHIERETDHILVGYVPNRKRPTVTGQMRLPDIHLEAALSTRHDVALSIQYDAKIDGEWRAFNVHTGLLPEWGGVDILYHTLHAGAHEQGATFHVVTDRFDHGPIVSRISYPVLPGDTIVTLYQRLAAIMPAFVVAGLRLVEIIGLDSVDQCASVEPTLYARGMVDEDDLPGYAGTLTELRRRYER